MAGPNHTYRHSNTCEVTGKRGYLTRKAARANRRAMTQGTGESISNVNVYRCPDCQMFHLGHLKRDTTEAS
jgi:hypothetical protein